jgi:polyisoprenyl-phosphate glycosyltransferase
MNDFSILLSIIVPLYNEEAVLPLFFAEILVVLKALNIMYEILFINDGSNDKTEEIVLNLKQKHPQIAYAKFSRNFGKEAAMTAGLKLCKGDAAIIIDADLQDPPSLIPDMIVAWKKGADVVNMKRLRRNGEPLWKIITANWFYGIIGKIGAVKIPRNVGDFRLFSRPAIDAINQLNERGRFMKGLYAWVGYPQTTIEYHRDKRAAGETKWPFLTAPLKIATWLGLLSSSGAFVYAAYFLIKNLFVHDAIKGFPTLIIVILFLGGLQLFCMGILGEYIARIYTEVKQRPLYLLEQYQPAQ